MGGGRESLDPLSELRSTAPQDRASLRGAARRETENGRVDLPGPAEAASPTASVGWVSL
jgi:hypothetical protein